VTNVNWFAPPPLLSKLLSMHTFTLPKLKIFYVFVLLCLANLANSQVTPENLKLSDFAIWGGSSSPSSYKSSQGVFIKEKATITGNIGSNHLIDIKENLTMTGNVYSGNGVYFNVSTKITGNVTANKTASNFSGTVISGDKKSDFKGNLTAKGKIILKTGSGSDATFVRGKVAVPSPTSTNYSGPAPAGGYTNTLVLPVLPSMPAITAFDNQVGTTNITTTQTISPGKYKKLQFNGNKILTFNGPGNYIFYDIDNSGVNKFVFDFKNTTTGAINIFVIKDARMGKLSVSTKNGNFPSRIYTEVHGDGTSCGGYSFDIESPDVMPASNYVWLGNVWLPNSGIVIKNLKTSTTPHIIGALWSADRVDIRENLVLTYQAPAAGSGPSFIEPYYPPPANGKVTATNKVIGAELLSLSQNTAPITSIPENEIFIIDNATAKVMIEVVSKTPNDNTLRSQLVTLGMTGIVDNGPHVYVITGSFPINRLTQLNTNTRIEYVRPLYPAISNAGQVITQGDTTMRSYQVRERFGLDGTGVKIGVISDSYNSKLTAQNDVDQGDLPGVKSAGLPPGNNLNPVQVVADLQRGNDEGRAMLQIVHDVAPKAKLAFRTGFLTAGDFAKGIAELASPTLPGGRCDVIVDDITYITEPFLRDGRVALAVDQAAAQGVTYFSSAGNFGNKSYEATFTGVTNTSIIPTGQIHVYGGTANDIYQSVQLKPGTYTIVLQWSDEFHSLGSTAGVQTDMDLYLVGANGFTLFGFNRSNLLGDPFEVCPFTVDEETTAKIMVVRAAGTANVRFKYIIFRGDGTLLDYPTGTSSIVGHPNANGAIAVGAMLYANIPAVTPVWPGVASFSSRGGTSTLVGTNFTVRNKPELIGPNGVNTTVNLGGAPFNDGDPYPNFFGTSAAAPHVAAVGALLIQGRKKFNLQTTVTPAEIRQQLQSSTGKFSYLPGNFSFEGGYGYVLADSAALQISNPKPLIETLTTTVPGAQNGAVPFQVKITGKYLLPTTQMYVGGVPVPTTISANRLEATATVPFIVSGTNPAFVLSNAAKSPSGQDGGSSNELFFFGSRIPVRIVAQNDSRKYGQSNPTFSAQVFVNGVPIANSNVSLATLKLDVNNISFATIATPTSTAGVYGIFPSRTTPLDLNDPLQTQYAFTFVSGALVVEKMKLKITPQNMRLKYGEFPGDVVYNYELTESPANSATLLEEVKALHKKYLADNGVIVVNGAGGQNPPLDQADLFNMSTMASFQSVYNARKFVLENGQLKPLVNQIDLSAIGNQRFIVDVAAQSLQNYKTNPAQSTLVPAGQDPDARGFLNVKSLSNGIAKAAIPNGQLKPMVNGQLVAMVNGQLQALVNGQLKALVNNVYVDAQDLVFQNGQLLALVNGVWSSISNGQLQAVVNGAPATIDLSLSNGQLQAMVNGQLMPLVNGQLQAVVNGQLVAMVNGQLKAVVNGQLMPLVNGQLVAVVNGQLQPMVNGQLVAIVNGQLMALVNGELEAVQNLTLANGQLQALVNGQLKPMVNGQLKAMVNGVVTDVPTDNFNIVNGQLQALVNGQLVAMVNGQLQALVNGQLKPLVNGAALAIESAKQLANGQLKAVVNNVEIPVANGQLQALVNGQLMAMVNGQLMAVVNGSLTFVVFQNGQLQALVNNSLTPITNQQLQPIIANQLKAVVNGQLQEINYGPGLSVLANGQLQAVVNGENWQFANGQLKAVVNGQLQALVNNFDVSGTNNNAKTLVLVDEDDINLQAGDVGGMLSMNMITGLDAGIQTLIPGSFVNENFEVTYGLGQVEIVPTLLTTKPDNKTKVFGDPNPPFTITYEGFVYQETASNITPPVASTTATAHSNAGVYPINVAGGSSNNYLFGYSFPGSLTITKKPLTVKADNQTNLVGTPIPPLTISYDGLVGDDTKDSVCIPYAIPPVPKTVDQILRLTTYTNVTLNGLATTVYQASPGETITLEYHSVTVYNDLTNYCPGCISQQYVGMAGPGGVPAFTDCFDVSLYLLTGPGTSLTVDRSKAFTAPTQPGVYYITQESSWQYICHGGGEGYPSNNPTRAFAVIVVDASNAEITASTTADENSGLGEYPITLQACSFYNPNYEVTLQDGILTIDGSALVSGRPGTGSNGSSSLVVNANDAETKKVISSSRIYPNPAITKVRLELKEEIQTKDLQVFDMVGRVNAVSLRKTGLGSFELNVTSLTKGVYFIKVKTATGFETFRFLKM
jgi:cytoskeletal protein CcmA (bactofilin family)